MKNFKKLIISILCFVFTLTSSIFFVGCGDRSAILKIYVPGNYISSETISGFESWYKQKTGKNIEVKTTLFSTCEEMHTFIATRKIDYDIICPSDYMVERMISEDLLIKLSSETQEIVENAISGDENENANFVSLIKSSYDANLEYTAPYMYGTMGIMYYYSGDLNDKTAVETADNAKSSWSCLFDDATNKVYMKDAPRDSYTIAMLNCYSTQLNTAKATYGVNSNEYKEILNKAFVAGEDFSSKLSQAKTALLNQKPNVYDYETDDGKLNFITTSQQFGYYGLFWSCDAGYIMSDFTGETPRYYENLRYVVPEEGSNLWIDNLCIPKYAKNTSAANLFIQYMMDEDVAFECMDFTGCTSGVYNTTVAYKEYLMPDDLTGLVANEDYDAVFYNKPDCFKAMYLSMLFPNLNITVGEYTINNVISRCGIMRDLGTQNNKDLIKMWNEVTM